MAAKPPPEHVLHYVELLGSLGEICARRMFGGWGFFHGGMMVALEYDGSLYLKADDRNRAKFSARGLPAFTFRSKDGRTTRTSYHLAPEEAMQQPAGMLPWARSALEAAERQRT